MNYGVALNCPRCKRTLESHSWNDATSGSCRSCEAEFDFFPFPALTAVRARIAPQAAVLADDSVCFFHATNRAESICEDCGRLLCQVCTVAFTGRKLCPTCISTSKASEVVTEVRERTLYDGIALGLAVLPVVTVAFWWMTIATAPIALGMVFYSWRKPSSLVRNSRIRLVIAAIFAVLEIGAWTFGLMKLWLT